MQKAKSSPFKYILFLYTFFIFLFSILLYQPFSNKVDLSFIDALFISSSALSVTGLTPVNISESLTTTGQILLMLEFQIGGIGVMAFFTYVLFFFDHDFSTKQLLIMSVDQNQKNTKSIKKIMLSVLTITIVIEFVGFLFIYPSVANHFGHSVDTLFLSIFHTVSSFTNAGFDLFGNSLIGFQTNGLFLLISSFLIILGVLGFPLLLDVLNFKQRKKSLFTKVNLTVHGLLLIGGSLFFVLSEWSNAFDNFSIKDKVINAFFLSSTSRSGGLTTIELSSAVNSTIILVLLFMFIGGSSSSCGGGIRTSTFAVIWSKIWSIATGKEEAVLFKKSVPSQTVNKSFLIFFAFLFIYFCSIIVVSFIEPFPMRDISFEVLSALTTTGLSTGITGNLSIYSKLLLSLLMLIGRIGIFTWIYLFLREKPTKTKYIKEDIIVG